MLLGGLAGSDDGIVMTHGAWYLVVGFVGSAALVLRRSRPVSVTLFTAAITLLLDTFDVRVLPLSLIIAIYSIAVYRSALAAWITSGALVAVVAATDSSPRSSSSTTPGS